MIPEIDIRDDLLCLSDIADYDEVDVLLHDIPNKGDIRPLIVGGRIQGGTFACSLSERVVASGLPLSLLIRLKAITGEISYLHVFINRIDDDMTITAIAL